MDFVYKSSVNSSAKGQKHQLPRKNILQVWFSNHTVAFLCALARLIPSFTAQKQELKHQVFKQLHGRPQLLSRCNTHGTSRSVPTDQGVQGVPWNGNVSHQSPTAEAVQDKNRNTRVLFSSWLSHLFQHTVRIHPKFVFKVWLNVVNMPVCFWCKSFTADNPSFQYNIKLPVLPFTYNKKYTIQPQVIFFTCESPRGGVVLRNTNSKRKMEADLFLS